MGAIRIYDNAFRYIEGERNAIQNAKHNTMFGSNVSCCGVSHISCGNYPYRKHFSPGALFPSCCSDIYSPAVKRKQESPLIEMGSGTALFLFLL